MNNLYHDVLVRRCELERTVLMNALALSSLAPDEFGYALMKGPGYFTTVAGELVHITKCVAAPVQVRVTDHCYQELPVSYNNRSYFLTPKSRILVQRGTLIECNTILPVGYLIDEAWFHLTPKAIRAPSPQQLQSMTVSTWNYENPEHLATSGIYSSTDL
ncbi:GSCOCG00011906001-RA-CDS [Cotesia congregata]|nr:GSCOCG00011906001-RA-CDS [Cotesia congregata]